MHAVGERGITEIMGKAKKIVYVCLDLRLVHRADISFVQALVIVKGEVGEVGVVASVVQLEVAEVVAPEVGGEVGVAELEVVEDLKVPMVVEVVEEEGEEAGVGG